MKYVFYALEFLSLVVALFGFTSKNYIGGIWFVLFALIFYIIGDKLEKRKLNKKK